MMIILGRWIVPFRVYMMWIAFQCMLADITIGAFIQYRHCPGACVMSGEQIAYTLFVCTPGAVVIYRWIFLASRAISRLVARRREARW